uniref:Uncharacterized protein n=1 Tax=Ascaris lumbricoides TaxID=6252 RepID=A0A0M3ITJ2_ASCLU
MTTMRSCIHHRYNIQMYNCSCLFVCDTITNSHSVWSKTIMH